MFFNSYISMTLDENYFLRENTLFSKNFLYFWPTDLNDATLTLQQAPYSPSKKHFLDVRPLSAFGEEILEKQTESWSFAIFVKSALYFFLHEKVSRRKKSREPSLCKFDWILIVPLLLNSSLNKEIILFLDENYNVPNDFKVVAAHFALKRLYLFDQLVMTEKSLSDFLVFLKIDEISRKTLVKITFKDKNFSKLADFLFVFNSSLNQNFVLSEVLQNYRYYNKSETFFKTLKYKDQLISEVFELKLANLEIFNVFDMFESAEYAKSKTSELVFFSFYELLLENDSMSINLDFVGIFQLFEKFIHDSKDKSILLAEISFEKSSQFYIFLEKFYYAYQQTIIKILSKQIKFIKKLSKKEIPYDVIGIGSIFAFLTLLSILGLRPTALSSETSRKKPLIAPQNGCFAMISSTWQTQLNVNRTPSESSLKLTGTGITPPVTVGENRGALVQKRPNQKVVLSASLPSGGEGAAIYTESTLEKALSIDSGVQKGQKDEGISLFISANSSFFKGMSPEKCIDLLIQDIEKKIPDCYITVRQKYGSVNGIIQKLNNITISGSVSQYGRLARLKTEVLSDTRCTSGVLILNQYEQLQMDHISSKKLRDILRITETRGACVFVESFIHTKFTDGRKLLASQVPQGLGYLPGDGGSLAILEHYEQQDDALIKNFQNNIGMCEGLESIDFSEKDLRNSYAKAHKIERDLILHNMENMG